MVKCSKCGRHIGFFSSKEICSDCENKLKREKEKQARIAQYEDMLDQCYESMIDCLKEKKFGEHAANKCIPCYEKRSEKMPKCVYDCFNDICIHCEYFKNGHCKRYPKHRKVSKNDTCGEFKISEILHQYQIHYEIFSSQVDDLKKSLKSLKS